MRSGRKSYLHSISRYFVAAIALAGIVYGSSAPGAVSDTYDWFEDADGYAEAYEIANTQKRPLIIYFHVEWCGYCKYLNDEFLDDYDVDDYISNYLRVKINPEDGIEEEEISKEYGVRGFPTFLVTYPHVKKVKRVHPFKKGGHVWSTDRFIKEIQLVVDDAGG